MDELEIFIRLALPGLAALMLALSLMSFAKTKEPKLGFATIGFGVFFAEGLLLSAGVFSESVEGAISVGLLAGTNLLALAFLYLSVLKR